eukprot:3733217-Pleurochrysis_carterae.AAC.2
MASTSRLKQSAPESSVAGAVIRGISHRTTLPGSSSLRPAPFTPEYANGKLPSCITLAITDAEITGVSRRLQRLYGSMLRSSSQAR